ncbi:MAG: hypothetical protein A2172_05040 [Candidatus Woykebacteria bacterium RBG_13_40_15]|uniref:Phosphatidic acid phosphatase type 2/haloperoxidase domain-containing protein n=1 Tax=Candidatus Woykebacteria bacterium RBG_13_40_15 TaxID=1802593 RepID=A0A1G1W8C2_9BACT|nr:MAG: hypothetical protein A2172_05040 [Candidatus Woykebacteria bacterium RBG_13_40_15]
MREKIGQNLINILLFAYLAVVIIFMLVKNISITPDRLFIFLLFAAVIVGRGKTFLRDWLPFLALLLGYEMLRGLADNFFSVHTSLLVTWEKLLFFGHIPTEFLQHVFYKAGQIGFIDIFATLMYFVHFPLPLAIAFFLWLKNRREYLLFVISFVILSFAGFITYLLFPAAPPWYASDHGLIHVTKITNLVVEKLGWSWNLSFYYTHLNPNQVAAIPSLHAAFPTLSLLSLRHYSKRLFWFFLAYPLLVWFSIVYLGEHYVVDIIAGVLYAVAAYYVVYNFEEIKKYFKELSKLLRVRLVSLTRRG